MSTEDEKLMKELCTKLDKQHKQNTEIIVHLKAFISVFLRVMDRVLQRMGSDEED